MRPALWSRQVPGLFAEQLAVTPRSTEGPFYPDTLPLDTDNDLIVVNDDTTPAVGEVTYLSGRVLDRSGQPVPNAVVEIWQCDAKGFTTTQAAEMRSSGETRTFSVLDDF